MELQGQVHSCEAEGVVVVFLEEDTEAAVGQETHIGITRTAGVNDLGSGPGTATVARDVNRVVVSTMSTWIPKIDKVVVFRWVGSHRALTVWVRKVVCRPVRRPRLTSIVGAGKEPWALATAPAVKVSGCEQYGTILELRDLIL